MTNSRYGLSRTQLNTWFNTPSSLLSYEAIAAEMQTIFNQGQEEADHITVTADDAQNIFRANGYNLRKRPQKADLRYLVTVIEDAPTVEESTDEVLTDTVNEPDTVDAVYSSVS